jgi:hypothetical protein
VPIDGNGEGVYHKGGEERFSSREGGMDESNELVEARVLVPRIRLADFYELCSRWLREDYDVLTHTDESTRLSDLVDELTDADAERSWVEGVEVGRIADAINVYDRLSPGAKKILDALLDRPGEEISGESLATQVNLSPDKLTGTLASISIRCRGVNRDVPYRYEAGLSGGTYVVDADVAKLFHFARKPPDRMLEAARNYADARAKYKLRKSNPPMIKGAHFESTLSATINRMRLNVFEVELVSWAERLMEEFNKTSQVSGEHLPAERVEREQLEEEVQMVDAG